MDTTVPAAKGFKQTDAWSTESLLALGLSDTRFYRCMGSMLDKCMETPRRKTKI